MQVTEQKQYARARIELVNAVQTLEDLEVQTHPDFKATTKFPAGSYIVAHKNGQQEILEEWVFNKYYKELQAG